jgi:hypothetical protein
MIAFKASFSYSEKLQPYESGPNLLSKFSSVYAVMEVVKFAAEYWLLLLLLRFFN